MEISNIFLNSLTLKTMNLALEGTFNQGDTLLRIAGLMMDDEAQIAEVEADLRGNTLRVYWYMLTKNEPVGVREVQRALGMSSPSVSAHHLGKLVSLDLTTKLPDNSYELTKIVKVGVLRNFVAYRGVLLPRYTFIAMFFTMYTLAYSILTLIAPIGIFDRLVAFGVGAVGAIFAWFESYRLWRLKLV
jgi:hypothetical protein